MCLIVVACIWVWAFLVKFSISQLMVWDFIGFGLINCETKLQSILLSTRNHGHFM